MKYVPVLSRRTMFFCFISLFLVYIFYAFNACTVDENKITLNYVFLRQHISKYKSATFRLASILGLHVNDSDKSRSPRAAPVKRLPDALIIGVKKCGTRALLEFLRLHPDVRAARSEVHFFDRFYHKGFEWYRERMPPSLAGQLTMEKTPSYWVTRAAPRRLRSMSAAVRLLVVVRDPVTRAVSDYTQSASKRPLPAFEQLALSNRSGGAAVESSWAPLRLGEYWRALRRWLRVFPRHNLLIVSGERLVKDPAQEMDKVQFLGLRPVISSHHFYLNSSKGFPCIVRANSPPRCLGRSKGRSHPPVDPAAIRELRDFYRPLNRRFYRLAGEDFGWP